VVVVVRVHAVSPRAGPLVDVEQALDARRIRGHGLQVEKQGAGIVWKGSVVLQYDRPDLCFRPGRFHTVTYMNVFEASKHGPGIGDDPQEDVRWHLPSNLHQMPQDLLDLYRISGHGSYIHG
jgi:hypothetical protein